MSTDPRPTQSSSAQRFYVVGPAGLFGPLTHGFACEMRDSAKRLYDHECSVRDGRDLALDLRQHGQTIREVAEQLHLPRSTVGDWLRGVPLLRREGFLGECAWCGDLFFTTDRRRMYCSRQHTVAAAHRAERDRAHA